MSSESHKHSKQTSGSRKPSQEPEKLTMVSDYLKRTLSERPYAFILESLSERLEGGKSDRILRSVGLITAPADFDPLQIVGNKTVAFVPYCCKPFDCPLNEQYGRKSNVCQEVSDKCEHTSCTIGAFIRIARKLGIKEFYVINADSDLIRWLARKHEEGYTHCVGVACEFAVCYALEVIHGQLGFDGLIMIINGDKCRNKTDYSESDESDRGRLTFIDEWTLMALEDIAKEICNNHQVPAQKAEVSNTTHK